MGARPTLAPRERGPLEGLLGHKTIRGPRDRKPGTHKITTRRAATLTTYPGQIGVSGSSVTADLGTTSVTAPLRDDEETKRSNGYQRAFLVLSLDVPLKPCYCATKNDIQRRLQDGPAWPCTGELCPCICRQPPGIVSACRRDDLGVAKANVTGNGLRLSAAFLRSRKAHQGKHPRRLVWSCRKTNQLTDQSPK